MLRGNRQRALALWVAATGVIIATLGVIGYFSGRLVSIFDPAISALALTAIGLALCIRGLALYRSHAEQQALRLGPSSNVSPGELQIAHGHSSAHRAELERSEMCRCFFCLATFPATEIEQWIEDRGGETAICPRCGIDSVIGSASGIDMSDAFFGEMRRHWFF